MIPKLKAGYLRKMTQASVLILCCALLVANPAEAPAADSGGFFKRTGYPSGSVVRLHVLAHSNRPQDQRYKSQVVEQVKLFLSETALPVEGDYLDRLAQILPKMEESLQGYTGREPERVSINVCLTREFFPLRVYDRTVYPAGEYYALKVVIGEGKGENWWCLLFPSLCLPLTEKDDSPVQEAAPGDMQGRLQQEEKQTGKNRRWSFAIWDWLSGLLNKN